MARTPHGSALVRNQHFSLDAGQGLSEDRCRQTIRSLGPGRCAPRPSKGGSFGFWLYFVSQSSCDSPGKSAEPLAGDLPIPSTKARCRPPFTCAPSGKPEMREVGNAQIRVYASARPRWSLPRAARVTDARCTSPTFRVHVSTTFRLYAFTSAGTPAPASRGSRLPSSRPSRRTGP